MKNAKMRIQNKANRPNKKFFTKSIRRNEGAPETLIVLYSLIICTVFLVERFYAFLDHYRLVDLNGRKEKNKGIAYRYNFDHFKVLLQLSVQNQSPKTATTLRALF